MDVYNGKLPETIEDLTSLAGVGRKTANVIRGNIYNDPSIVVDTHVRRISAKLGLTKSKDPEKIEYDLMKVLPMDHWIFTTCRSLHWADRFVRQEIQNAANVF